MPIQDSVHHRQSEVEVSLQGTLETISLPDVLVLLAATKKTGELRITGALGDGRLWLDAGMVVAADVPRASRPVDAVFELLRLSAGTFTFGDESPAADPGEPIAVDALLAEAQQRLTAWQAIEAVVPSMTCTLRLTPELGYDNVTVSRQQWKELVAVAAGGDVNGAMKRLGLGEFDTCRTVKELVDAGLVQVGKAPAPPARAPEPPPPVAPTEPAPGARLRRPPPTVGAVPAHPTSNGPSDPGRPAPVPVPARSAHADGPAATAPAPAAPVSVANGGRSAAPRRGLSAVRAPNREETEEMVHQLASLGTSQTRATPAMAGAIPPGDGAGSEKGRPVTAAKGDPKDEGTPQANGDEPINRGMLLKFLSSVRP